MSKKQTIKEQILERLRDGQPHSVDEFHELCRPSSRPAVFFHILMIRKHMLREEEIIASVVKNRQVFYQLFYRYDKVQLD